MARFDYQSAKSAGYTDDEIQAFLKSNPDLTVEQEQPAQPTDVPPVNQLLGQPELPYQESTNPYQSPQGAEVYQPKPEDVVSPFNREDVPVTQDFGNYNPGMGYFDDTHKGIDFGVAEGEQGKNPVGGVVSENYYDPVYGNRFAVIGQNPQETAQNPQPQTDPNEDVIAMSHLLGQVNNPKTGQPYQPGDPIATGEAQLQFGNTGSSTGPHTDIESFNVGNYGNYGAYNDPKEMLRKNEMMKRILATYR